MKSLWAFLRRYWYPLIFVVVAAWAILAGSSSDLAYDQRTYLTVLGGILIMLSFKLIDHIDAAVARKKAKEQEAEKDKEVLTR